MRRALLVLALAALAGCDRARLGQDEGQFEARLSGAIDAALSGTATVAVADCASFTFSAPELSLFLVGNCDGEPGQPPPRGGFAVTEPIGRGYTLTFREPGGASYRAVNGTVEIERSDREAVAGRLSAEARPTLDGAVTDGPAVTVEATFEAVAVAAVSLGTGG